MGVHIERTDLPGIGIRYDVILGNGRQIGIVAHRDGERDLAVYDEFDPDSCTALVRMSQEEAGTLAEVLGASTLISQLTGNQDSNVDLQTENFSLPARSVYAGKTLGTTEARSKTGVSIVAISRGGSVIPSPGPEAQLLAGDVLVAIGTRRGLDALGQLLATND